VPTNNIISRTDAGALMPEQVSNAILKGLDSESVTLNQFTHLPVGRNQLRLPVLSALPVAYWVSGDTGQKQTTEVDWANKFLNIEELAVIVPIPENVLDDSGVPIWSQVQPLCEQAAGRLVDSTVFFGASAPASFPTNVVSAATAAGNAVTRGANNAAAGGIVGDWSDMLGLLETDGYDANTAIAVRTYRGRFRQARSTQGERLEEITITPDYVEIDGVRILFPMRGLWPTAGGSAEAIAFDQTQFVVGVRQDITWKLLTEAVIQDNTGAIVYNLAQQDMVAMRMTMRVGWQVANTINYDQPVEASRYPASLIHS
jgi:HK97 family phage major capsid protein